MSHFCYSAALFLGSLVLLPKFLFDWIFRNKYHESLPLRLKRKGPQPKGTPSIWLHGVSVGEVKALATLVFLIRKTYPKAFILVSTITETGQACAKKEVKGADACVYLPLDFSSIIRPYVQSISPDLLILVEGDYWPNLIKSVKEGGGKVVVASGRISEKSMKRYQIFRPLVNLFFSDIDAFGMQSKIHQTRMKKMGIPSEKLYVTGNLKFDSSVLSLSEKDREDFKKRLGVYKSDIVVTIGSTHKGEDILLLKEFQKLMAKWSNLKVLLVPRHPERFAEVEYELKKGAYSFGVFSRKEKGFPIQLIDQMGVLMSCYQVSDLAVVGGSFVPGVGGHNIFEPAQVGTPVLFGPHMENQLALVERIFDVGAGKQLSVENLARCAEELFSGEKERREMSENGKRLIAQVSGSAERTWKMILSSSLK